MRADELNEIAKWFEAYAQTFARNNGGLHPLLQLKVDHSRRVARDAEDLVQDLDWLSSDVNAAKALGLLHDVGRFPQFAEYQTFSDAVSVDHGQYGQAIAANASVLSSLAPAERNRILDGIRHHNAKSIPVDLTPSSLPFLKLIRDADKLDIFLVVLDAVETDGFRDLPVMLPNVTLDRSCSSEIIQDIKNHRCCSLDNVKSLGDFLVMQLSWVFDLNYRPAFQRFSHRRIMSRIFRQLPEDAYTKHIGTMVEEFVADHLKNSKMLRPSRKSAPRCV
jgi:hypothetical protein